MLAAILTSRRSWTVDEVPDPKPANGEVLVRTEIAAICGSDVHQVSEMDSVQPPGFPGHEGVGIVTESRTPQYSPGERVLCVPPAAMARGFAELQTLSAGAVLPLPAAGSPADLVIAQQLGTAIFAMKRFWPARMGSGTNRTAAVLGTGPAGLAFVKLLRGMGFELVLASDLSRVRLAAAAALGAGFLIHAPAEDAVEVAMEVTSGVGVDLVVEAAGKDVTRHQAMRMVRVDGRIGLFGVEEHQGMSPYPLAEVFRRRPTIEMIWGAQNEAGLASFVEASNTVTTDSNPELQLVTHHFLLTDIGAAFDCAENPESGSVKVAIDF